MSKFKKSILLASLLLASNAFGWHEEFATKVGTVVHGDNFISMGGIRAGTGLRLIRHHLMAFN